MITEHGVSPRTAADARLLRQAAEHAARFIETLPDKPVHPETGVEQLRAELDVPLPDQPQPADRVFEDLVTAASKGLAGTASPRYFGFVIGGGLPAAVAADFMASTWDQTAGLYVCGPSASVVEEATGRWLKELLGLPAGASFALTTGCMMAHFTALAAARHRVLEDAGWDVEADGLTGAPRIRVLVGASRHVTVDRAVRFLGLGHGSLIPVECDRQGRMLPDALRTALAEYAGPLVVCTQAGDVNTGAIDPMREICQLAHEAGAWVHVDGAFGLWAAASPELRGLMDGVGEADSWGTDCHKWLNVPYDSGLAFCAHPRAHAAAMAAQASYLEQSDDGGPRDALNWTPEFSRRARGFAVYAALRSLGRQGVADLVEQSCAHARRFASLLAADAHAEVLNEVVLNQVLVRFHAGGDDDAHTRAVIAGVQEEGTCWMSGTTWQGMAAMRISVSNWRTNAEDVERSAAAVLRVASALRA